MTRVRLLLGAAAVSLALALLPTDPALAAFPGENGKLVFRSSEPGCTPPCDSNIYSANPDGSGRTRLTSQVGDAYYPAWSPDGTKVAFAANYAGNFDIYVMSASGAGVTQLTADPATDSEPAWSPDGTKIVFTSDRDGSADLYTMNANGSAVTQLTNDGDREGSPVWSPTGTQIAFDQPTPPSGPIRRIYTMSADGPPKTQVSPPWRCYIDPDYSGLDWSPDGERLTLALYGYEYCIVDDYASAVGTVKVDGTDERILDQGDIFSFYWGPAWSPDGSRIAFADDLTGVINVIDSDDGGNKTSVTNGDMVDWQAITPPGYARPKSATPTRIRLVPAYRSCTIGNGLHGPPLALSSCNPPVQESDYATVGVGDGHPTAAKSAGSIVLKVLGESPIDPSNGDQADVQLTASITDVRRKSDLSDYAGELRVSPTIRMTDRFSDGGQFSPPIHPATTTDAPFGFTLSCLPTADGTIGSTCSASTTADAVMPGIAREGKRAVWQLSQVQVFDGGADGDADTTGDNTLFAVQGLFAP